MHFLLLTAAADTAAADSVADAVRTDVVIGRRLIHVVESLSTFSMSFEQHMSPLSMRSYPFTT